MPRSPIIVVGPGRCGTSAVAGILYQFGVHMGDKLEPGNQHNPWGHFEDVEIKETNQAALDSVISEFTWTQHMRRFVADRAAHPLWGFKDPRTCYFLPQFLSLLPPSAYFLWCQRPLPDIAQSCRHHYGWPHEYATTLMHQRFTLCQKHLPDDRTRIVQFDMLVTEPEHVVDALIEILGLDTEYRDQAVQHIRVKEKANG